MIETLTRPRPGILKNSSGGLKAGVTGAHDGPRMHPPPPLSLPQYSASLLLHSTAQATPSPRQHKQKALTRCHPTPCRTACSGASFNVPCADGQRGPLPSSCSACMSILHVYILPALTAARGSQLSAVNVLVFVSSSSRFHSLERWGRKFGWHRGTFGVKWIGILCRVLPPQTHARE
jgi:hypothetical protein